MSMSDPIQSAYEKFEAARLIHDGPPGRSPSGPGRGRCTHLRRCQVEPQSERDLAGIPQDRLWRMWQEELAAAKVEVGVDYTVH